MIFEAIFQVIRIVLAGIRLLLPSWSPVDFGGMASTVVGGIPVGVSSWLRWSNYYFPSSEVAVAVGLVLTLYVALHIYTAIVWALSKVHILGGGSK